MEAVRDLMKVVPDLMEAVLIRSGGDYDLMKVVPDRDELTVGVWEGGGFEAVGEGSRTGRLGDGGGRESGGGLGEVNGEADLCRWEEKEIKRRRHS
ncbi:hypothetical protein L2E82_19423 [Cichorium intybus]|uniref:Uncharacterized protein n=1 Tax=Cichorium intybus TaxID=13427 RepID=A0ACB9FCI7_CICIN|nr:hypothetical protein L2E82_19423 [Cichorium intybus]